MTDDPTARDTDERHDAPERDDAGELPGFDAMIGTFLRESTLWPVLAVAVGSGGAFTAALIVLVTVDRNPFAAAALLLLFGMTVDVAIRARTRESYRNGALLLGLVWGAGLLLTGVAISTGIAF